MSGRAAEYVFDTKHDRYPVAAHLILRDPEGRILLMQRAGTDYGEGQLGLPVGHVDLGETPTQSIVRETYEELGIIITPVSLAPAGVMFRRSLEPRIDFFFTTDTWSGTPRICEPHKCTELTWCDPDDLPAGTLEYISAVIDNLASGRHFSEHGWEPTVRLHWQATYPAERSLPTDGMPPVLPAQPGLKPRGLLVQVADLGRVRPVGGGEQRPDRL